MSTLPRTLFKLAGPESGGTLIFLPDMGGNVLYANALVRAMAGSAVCLGARLDDAMSREINALPVSELGRRFAQDILRADLPRPLHLAGFSFAGFVAFETARHLEALGAAADNLWLLDSEVMRKLPYGWTQWAKPAELRYALGYARQNWRSLLGLGSDPNILHAYCEVRMDLSDHPMAYRDIIRGLYGAMMDYRPDPWPDGKAVVVRAATSYYPGGAPDDLSWGQLIPRCEVRVIPGDHLGMLKDPLSVGQVVALMKKDLLATSVEAPQ
jgi:thioesterase domain-containing protein